MVVKHKEEKDMNNRKAPTLLVLGFIVIFCILLYNYWILSQKNVMLREALLTDQEKISEVEEKKSHAEKQNGINLDRIKYFEERINANSQAMKQKDNEIDELNSKLKSKNQEYDKLLVDMTEVKEKLTFCNSEKESETSKILTQYNEVKLNLTEANKMLKKYEQESTMPKTDCLPETKKQLSLFKVDLISKINKSFDEKTATKLSLILNEADNGVNVQAANNTSDNVTTKANLEPKVLRDTDLIDTDDICKLPKNQGDKECKNETERYYYDRNSEKCLIFVYTGCNGNLNNFETLEACRNKCINATLNSGEKDKRELNLHMPPALHIKEASTNNTNILTKVK